jgi:hypothetical protein
VLALGPNPGTRFGSGFGSGQQLLLRIWLQLMCGPAAAASGCSQLLVGLRQSQHSGIVLLADAAAHKLDMIKALGAVALA